MNRPITYRKIQKGEENEVCGLVADCFNEFVAPDYVQQGRDEFFKYLNPDSLARHLANEHFILVASCGSTIAGMIEVRQNFHISLLFVKRAYQKRGIARELVKTAIDECRQAKPDVAFIEVNSSPYAVPIYEKLGFIRNNEEQTMNGMRFTPMVLRLYDK